MKISTKGRYALRMLLYLALHDADGYTALKDIAEEENISKKYLEQIVPVLNKAGILLTVRGFQGGYKLSKEPSKITLGDVLRATEGNLAPVACLEDDSVDCPRCNICNTVSVWKGLEKVINDYVDSLTLQDIIDSNIAESSSNYII